MLFRVILSYLSTMLTPLVRLTIMLVRAIIILVITIRMRIIVTIVVVRGYYF